MDLDAAWALTMAAYDVNLPPHTLALELFLAALRATLLHSAGCVINDICDAEFDRQVGKNASSPIYIVTLLRPYTDVVERTKNRPLAAGHISFTESWMVFAALTGPSVSMFFRMNLTA